MGVQKSNCKRQLEIRGCEVDSEKGNSKRVEEEDCIETLRGDSNKYSRSSVCKF